MKKEYLLGGLLGNLDLEPQTPKASATTDVLQEPTYRAAFRSALGFRVFGFRV